MKVTIKHGHAGFVPSCDNCGDLEFGLLGGYSVGERILEGVKFKVSFDDDELTVETDAGSARYMKNLNERHWLDAAADMAKQADVLACPNCGEDIDGPDAC